MNFLKEYTMKMKLCNPIGLLALSLLIVISSCKNTYDFLTLPDREGMDGRIWNDEGSVQYLLNETYYVSMPEFPYQNTANNYDMFVASDENAYSVIKEWTQKYFGIFNGGTRILSDNVKFIGTKYQGDNLGDNRFFDIAKSNLALEMLPSSTINEARKKEFLGQFQLLRAINYLNLVRYYGGVPLITKPLSPQTIEAVPRSKAGEIFKLIVADCDAAIQNLDGVTYGYSPAVPAQGKLTKAAAAAWKARALLWWASPLFNPVNDPAHPYDVARWTEANKAAKEAYEICKQQGIALLSDYSRVFQIEGAANTEALVVRSYSPTVEKRNNNAEARSRPTSESGSPDDCYRTTVNLVRAYPMKDGMAVNTPGKYVYDDVHFWINRDPRFYATIAYNGGEWKLSGKNGRRQWSYEGETDGKVPLYCKRFASPDLAATGVKLNGDFGGAGMDWIEMRFAEVILIYAETANEVGDIGTAKDMVRLIRQRAGVEQGAYDYGLSSAGTKEAMRDLILNERMVEFAFESKRNDDLRRTRRMHLLNGSQILFYKTVKLRPTYWVGPGVKDSLNPKTFLATVLSTDATRTARDTVNFNNPSSVDKFFQAYDASGGADRPNVSVNADQYFFPLNNAFLYSSSLLQQTIGWEGGTFDPL